MSLGRVKAWQQRPSVRNVEIRARSSSARRRPRWRRLCAATHAVTPASSRSMRRRRSRPWSRGAAASATACASGRWVNPRQSRPSSTSAVTRANICPSFATTGCSEGNVQRGPFRPAVRRVERSWICVDLRRGSDPAISATCRAAVARRSTSAGGRCFRAGSRGDPCIDADPA
jgi:hypothetical protein